MAAATEQELAAWKRQCQFVYAFLDQGEVWFPKGRPRVRVADMDEAWRLNTTRFMERRASYYALRYNMGEIFALSEPTMRNVVGEYAGQPIEHGPAFSHLDLMGDLAHDAFEWIRTTALYRALAAGLPNCSAALEALKERAQHYSTCPQRIGQPGNCTCHLSECAIRNGNPELGCTCRDTSPEWTL
jgi:hypothetical protein